MIEMVISTNEDSDMVDDAVVRIILTHQHTHIIDTTGRMLSCLMDYFTRYPIYRRGFSVFYIDRSTSVDVLCEEIGFLYCSDALVIRNYGDIEKKYSGSKKKIINKLVSYCRKDIVLMRMLEDAALLNHQESISGSARLSSDFSTCTEFQISNYLDSLKKKFKTTTDYMRESESEIENDASSEM